MLPTPPSFPFLGRVLSWINQHTQRGDPTSTGREKYKLVLYNEREREIDRERLKDRDRER